MIEMSERWASTPIVNYVVSWSGEQSYGFCDEMLAVGLTPSKMGIRPVQLMKERLGKQDYCWTGEFRFWVWEQSNWRVFVSNQKGICFEVREDLDYAHVRAAWDDFRTKIGAITNEQVVGMGMGSR